MALNMHPVLEKLLLQLLTPTRKKEGVLVKLQVHRKAGSILGAVTKGKS